MSNKLFSSVAISLILMGMPFLCSAQVEQQPQMQERPSAKQMAEAQAKRLEKELQLTEKQYKQVYSLYLEEQKLRESLMSSGPMGGMPEGAGPGGPGMGRPGMGGPGMGNPGMGGPGMGNQGGPVMGRPGGDGKKMGPPNGMPAMADIENSTEMQQFQQKKEKKMRKILTEQQYSIWEAQELQRIMEPTFTEDNPTK